MKRKILSAVMMTVLGLNVLAQSDATLEKESESGIIKTFSVNGVRVDMVPVQGGTFMMGTTSAQDAEAFDDEAPAHQVTLSSYWIGETEVTQELWDAVMGAGFACSYKGAQNPINSVSYFDCVKFIDQLNVLMKDYLPEGMVFRLPTEAEWEYAARGGNKSKGYKYSGSNKLEEVAWYYQNSSDEWLEKDEYDHTKHCQNNGRLHPVGQKAPNELGLYDMNGNVWERCYEVYYEYTGSNQTDPQGMMPNELDYNVVRGGSYTSNSQFCRVVCRDGIMAIDQGINNGLRLCIGKPLRR